MVEMHVAGIALDAASRSPIVLLRDPSGRRQVPIWIDQAQAQNILAGINRERPPRPLTHDLMAQLLNLAGLRLERVIVHAIEDNTFRAVLKLVNAAGESSDMDARPSDAIALALRGSRGFPPLSRPNQPGGIDPPSPQSGARSLPRRARRRGRSRRLPARVLR
jgi:bifunctional DNase/RNase